LAVRRSCDHAMVVRRVCWRGSASRPPLRRSRRWERRSKICAGGERLRARGGEFDSERKVVEPSAELGDLVRGLELRALGEQRHGLGPR
jgi:hypothetical protein